MAICQYPTRVESKVPFAGAWYERIFCIPISSFFGESKAYKISVKNSLGPYTTTKHASLGLRGYCGSLSMTA